MIHVIQYPAADLHQLPEVLPGGLVEVARVLRGGVKVVTSSLNTQQTYDNGNATKNNSNGNGTTTTTTTTNTNNNDNNNDNDNDHTNSNTNSSNSNEQGQKPNGHRIVISDCRQNSPPERLSRKSLETCISELSENVMNIS